MPAQIETAEPFRCLSIQQPYAWAVCSGLKTVENRSWSTDFRGLIAIHASAAKQRVTRFVRESKPRNLTADVFNYSAIVGVAELNNVVEMNPNLESDPFAIGEYCWLLRNARLLPRPVPCKGKLRLYTLSTDESVQVKQQLSGLEPAAITAESQAWREVLGEERDGVDLARAKSYMNLGCGDDAIRHFDRAIGLAPDDARLYYGRAYVWTYLKDEPRKGVDDCTRALALSPEEAVFYMQRAEAYRQLGEDEYADSDERQAEALDPEIVEEWKADDEDNANEPIE